jgi:hypothetical protein
VKSSITSVLSANRFKVVTGQNGGDAANTQTRAGTPNKTIPNGQTKHQGSPPRCGKTKHARNGTRHRKPGLSNRTSQSVGNEAIQHIRTVHLGARMVARGTHFKQSIHQDFTNDTKNKKK